jgi:hypothetical protein
MAFWSKNNPSTALRTIKTARDVESINEAVLKGFKPLIKKIKPSKKIRSKYAVIQNKKTGEIALLGDYRSFGFFSEHKNEFEMVINWTFYYPYAFENPFAAYLIPHDIEIGERVFIEDLIEDYVGGQWNQGDTFRLESCEAIWTGKDFKIQNNRRPSSLIFG